MKSIECINFVSKDAPNILLIADINNDCATGLHLKHFKNSHNIYTLIHIIDNKDIIYNTHYDNFYIDLPSKHYKIVTELNKHNLYNFTISSLSFGCIMAYYIIFHLPERVEKAFIHDFHWKSTKSIFNLNQIKYNNWQFPKKSNIPILFFIHTGIHVNISRLKQLRKIFKNISIFMHPSRHTSKELPDDYKASLEIVSKFFNGFRIEKFRNKWYPKWMNNQHKFKTRKLHLWLFIYLFKRNK